MDFYPITIWKMRHKIWPICDISGLGFARCSRSFNGWKVSFAVCSKLCKWGLQGHRWFAQTEQLWVLDSVPGQVSRENSDGEVDKVWRTLQSLPSTVPSRRRGRWVELALLISSLTSVK
ncbi:uncharacterized protein [Primulina huaijiensis]|uniref:uncharacterized protein isoform X2 n=1 Tax=Primulina huaijiensis TaxID=1492673 RepID=UPI003CC74D47